MKTSINAVAAQSRARQMSSRLGLLALACLFSVGAHANPKSDRDDAEPKADVRGVIQKKIEHRLPDWLQNVSPFAVNASKAYMSLVPQGSKAANALPISYHNGPIMPTVSKIVVIWYGNWAQGNGSDNAAGQQIILDSLYGLSIKSSINQTTNYSGITTGELSSLGVYNQLDKKYVTAISSATIQQFTQGSSVASGGGKYGGSTLTDDGVTQLVKDKAGATEDENAIYLVLSSSDIRESSGFMITYCGWHTFYNSETSGKPIKYAFIGNANSKPFACNAQSTYRSPNANPGADAMVNIISHELTETVTDPEMSAWYNSLYSENSDMCSWTFGSAQKQMMNLSDRTTLGSSYNVTLPTPRGGVRKYLLQRQLARNDSKCYINATGGVQ